MPGVLTWCTLLWIQGSSARTGQLQARQRSSSRRSCHTSGSTWRSRPVRAAGIPLRVIGDGPELPRLRKLAGPRRHLLGLDHERRDSRRLPAGRRRAPARGGGFRHRAPRGAGLRQAGRRGGRGRRAGDGRGRRDGRPRAGQVTAGMGRSHPGHAGHATPGRSRSGFTRSGSAASVLHRRSGPRSIASSPSPNAWSLDTNGRSPPTTSSRTPCWASWRSSARTCSASRRHLIPVTKGVPPLEQYLVVVPFVGVLVPVAYYFQGLYSLRRNRSRVDDFFAVFVGSVVAVVLGVVTTLYFQAYYVPAAMKDRGAFEVSQLVWVLFLGLNVLLTFASREARAPVARPPVARRPRPQAHPDCRRGGTRAPRGGQDFRAPRDGLPRGGLRRRSGRARPSRLPGAAAARHDGRHGGHLPARAGRPDLHRPPARRAPSDARGDRGRREEPDRREDRPGPAPVHRAAGPHRRPRRRADHQPQRRAAAGPERDGQARDRPRSSRWSA